MCGDEADKTKTKQENNDGQSTTNIYKLSVKHAVFNRDDPEIWFLQLEVQFQLSGISADQTKYAHLVAALDSETIKCVRELLLNPPKTDKYDTLKAAIKDRLCDSNRMKLNRLLSGLQLGDKKPSQLLREMQALAADQITEAVLRDLWLQRLPNHIQEILSCVDEGELLKLAASADKISEINRPMGLYNVSQTPHSSSKEQPEQSIAARIDALSKRFDQFISNDRKPRDTQRRSCSEKPRSRSKSRSESQVRRFPNCWYHAKYGDQAKHCAKPCTYRQGTNAPEN